MNLEGLTEGRIVHYVLPEDAGPSAGQHRPAIVVKVWRVLPEGTPPPNGTSDLQVFTDGENDQLPDMMWKTSVEYDEHGGPGTWHWPEQA